MAKDAYEALLRATAFKESEILEFLPHWHRAADKLGLTEEDMRFAVEEWIPKHFDLSLEGFRKLVGCLIREITDLTRADEYKRQGVKIVYGIMPAISHYYYALKLTAPDKVFVGFPDMFLALFMNGLFHKLNPYLEEAESAGIPYGCRHCALNKTRYAARRLGVIPSPDISWIWGFVCDEGPKTDEFIHDYYDPEWKTVITRLPHDMPLGTPEDEIDERVEYLASQMKEGFKTVQKELGIEVPDEKIKEVITFWQRYVTKIGELKHLMASDPQPLGGLEGTLYSEPLAMPFNTGVEGMEDALDTTIRELKQRVANKQGILPEGAPKLMIYLMPSSLPWIPRMFEQNGVGLTFTDSGTPARKHLIPPRFEDPYMAAAETWLKRSPSINLGYKADIICEKLQTYKCDGMVFGFFDFDRWLGSDHRLLSKLVEERTKLPVFYIEGDIWEDRDYGPEALRTRIESICEIVKMRKA
ncbi:2-hydroxyacyl-CoA dehydratase [Chloroflexota bacterium]